VRNDLLETFGCLTFLIRSTPEELFQCGRKQGGGNAYTFLLKGRMLQLCVVRTTSANISTCNLRLIITRWDTDQYWDVMMIDASIGVSWKLECSWNLE